MSPAQTDHLDDLDLCAREPIHIPGSIQPHGALLAFELGSGTVLHASDNLADFLPTDNLPTLGRSISDLFGEAAAGQLASLNLSRGRSTVGHSLLDLPARPQAGQLHDLEAIVHVHRGVCVVEVERRPSDATPQDWMQSFNETLDTLRTAGDLEDLLQRVVSRVKRLTGFDRVMVYQFDEQWAGCVVAEAREAALPSYLDLHFPASDIPAQARELYRTNLVRYIADTHYTPVPINPWMERYQSVPLDMSHCVLRSVSPVHIRYMHNMGTGSSLTLSLMVNDRLWGLIACHHGSATQLPLRQRSAFYALSVTISFMLTSALQRLEEQARSSAREAADQIRAAFNQPDLDFDIVIEQSSAHLLRVATASGGAFWYGDRCYPFGRWPQPAVATELLGWAKRRLQESSQDVIATDALSLPDASTPIDTHDIRGLAALNLDPFGSVGLLWLRPEYRQEVRWGGDPNKPVEVSYDEQGRLVLNPRNSFAQWVVSERGKSRAWSESDLQALRGLTNLRQLLTMRDSLKQVMLANRQFRSLITLQSDAYWQVDEQGRLAVLSKSLLPSMTQVQGRSLPSLFATYCLPQDLAPLEQAIADKKPFRGLMIRSQPDGGAPKFLFQINGEPIRNPEEKVTGLHGTISDVTDRRISEENLQSIIEERTAHLMSAKVAAEQGTVAKNAFLANMSHEIRTPLNVVTGISRILRRSLTTPEQLDRLKHLDAAAKQLASIVDNILDLSLIEAEKFALTESTILLEQLVESLQHSFQPAATDKGLALSIEMDDFPSPLIGDQTRLLQCAGHYLSNAIKFTDQGSVRLTIRRDLETPKTQTLRLEVEDTGVGIAPAELKRLFSSFEQADNSLTRKYGGAGLGLALTAKLAGLMGGEAGATSEVGQGSRFWFTVVLKKLPTRYGDWVAEPGVAVVHDTFARPDKKILLVEDEPANREVALEYLREVDLTPDIAINGEEAVAKARETVYDLILMDTQMPVMNGIQATRRIRNMSSYHDTPILALTANTLAETRSACLAAGMNEVVSKPIDPDQLFGALHRWLGTTPPRPGVEPIAGSLQRKPSATVG